LTESEAPRPRAQYGEYATPEEQQRARGLPDPISEADAEPAATLKGDAPPPPPPATAAPSVDPVGPFAAAATAPKHPHPVDRVVTLVLLALGLFLVLNGIPGYLALADALQMVYDQLGAGTDPATEVATSLGVTAIVVQAVIWVATATSAWFAMKRGRLAWWIALVGGALSFIASMVIVSIALFADPGFIDSVSMENLTPSSF
jgi:hypothetical protein